MALKLLISEAKSERKVDIDLRSVPIQLRQPENITQNILYGWCRIACRNNVDTHRTWCPRLLG